MSLLLDVVLFIRSNAAVLKLSPMERVVLVALAARIGNNKDTWITQTALAKECVISTRYLIENLTSLITKKIIKIEKSGRKNRYQFTLEQVIHSSPIKEVVEEQYVNHSSPNIPEYVNHSSLYTGTTVQVSSPKKYEIPIINPELMPPPPPPKVTMKVTTKAKEQLVLSEMPSRFDEFWAVYPLKENKKKAREIWIRKKLDRKADILIADVIKRKACHKKWLEGFIPLPTTYLNGERWEDVITEVSNAESGAIAKLSPHQASLQRGWDVINNWH